MRYKKVYYLKLQINIDNHFHKLYTLHSIIIPGNLLKFHKGSHQVDLITLKEAWEGKANCQHCSIRNSVIFSGLNESHFETIHYYIDQFKLPAGSTLYHTINDAGYLYTIRTGVIKLQKPLADGSQRIVRLGFKADTIGLEALVESRYHHDAVALSDIEVCRLPAAIIHKLNSENPVLHKELINRWNKALKDADTWLTMLSTGSAKHRMANLLLKLVDKFETNRCPLFGREDIGSILGITTETASRTIAQFKRDNLIVKHDDYYLFDLQQLENILQN